MKTLISIVVVLVVMYLTVGVSESYKFQAISGDYAIWIND